MAHYVFGHGDIADGVLHYVDIVWRGQRNKDSNHIVGF